MSKNLRYDRNEENELFGRKFIMMSEMNCIVKTAMNSSTEECWMRKVSLLKKLVFGISF